MLVGMGRPLAGSRRGHRASANRSEGPAPSIVPETASAADRQPLTRRCNLTGGDPSMRETNRTVRRGAFAGAAAIALLLAACGSSSGGSSSNTTAAAGAATTAAGGARTDGRGRQRRPEGQDRQHLGLRDGHRGRWHDRRLQPLRGATGAKVELHRHPRLRDADPRRGRGRQPARHRAVPAARPGQAVRRQGGSAATPTCVAALETRTTTRSSSIS